MNREKILILIAIFVLVVLVTALGCGDGDGPNNGDNPRVLVVSDIGGADPDDNQSLVHLLLYADVIDIEGLVASTPKGKKDEILQLLNVYELDYPKLLESGNYPTPNQLRSVTKQGQRETGKIGPETEGSKHIIQMARKDDSRKLNVIVWGSLTDVATALKAAPDIASKINIISLGAWNTRQDRNAHSVLWNMRDVLTWTDINTTFRGLYRGWPIADNKNWVEKYTKPAGNLGKYFYDKSRFIDTGAHSIKMGDTPTFLIALRCNPELPVNPDCWGGEYRIKDANFPNYFTDLEGQSVESYAGAATIDRWRPQFLADFAMRLRRLR